MANPFTSKIAPMMPGDWQSQQQEIDYQRKLAEKLAGDTEMPQGGMVGGVYVAPAWTQMLAKALNPMWAKQHRESANEKATKLADAQMAERTGTLERFSTKLNGTPAVPGQDIYTDDYTAVPAADQQGYGAAAAVPGDRNAAMAELGKSRDRDLQNLYMAQMLQGLKPGEAFTLGQGQTRFGPDGKPIANVAAKTEKPFIRTRVMGDQEVQEQLQPDGSYQEIGRGPRFARQIAPVVNVGAEGRQGPIIQTDAGPMTVKGGVASPVLGPDGQPLKPKSTDKALPTSAAQKLMENNQNLRKAEQALTLISGEKAGGAEGDAAATGWKGYVPDAILQRTDPKGVSTRAAIGDLGSMVIHDRSGAAVTAAEFPRLRPFIPTVTDDPATVKKKLSRFVSEYKAVVDEAKDFYRGSGYKVPDAAGASGGWSDL